QRLDENTIAGGQVTVQQADQHPLVTHELPQARAELTAFRVEVATEGDRQRLLVDFGVLAQLSVQVLGQGRTDVLQARLLGLPIGVHQGAQADVPRVVGELLWLRFRQSLEGLYRIGARIAQQRPYGPGAGRDLSREGETRTNF